MVSLELGVHKPDPEVFARYIKKVGENTDMSDPISNWWYAGDLYEHDIEPAAKAGWHTIWVVHEEEDKTVQRDVEPDHIVRSGKELKEVLLKIAGQTC